MMSFLRVYIPKVEYNDYFRGDDYNKENEENIACIIAQHDEDLFNVKSKFNLIKIKTGSCVSEDALIKHARKENPEEGTFIHQEKIISDFLPLFRKIEMTDEDLENLPTSIIKHNITFESSLENIFKLLMVSGLPDLIEFYFENEEDIVNYRGFSRISQILTKKMNYKEYENPANLKNPYFLLNQDIKLEDKIMFTF